MRCWLSAARDLGLTVLLAAWALTAVAGNIEPTSAALAATDDGYALSAEFTVELGPRLEEAVSHGVPLVFNLEFTLDRDRWYWFDEHVASVVVNYRLSYNALTRQYRLAVGGLHRSFDTFAEAVEVLGHVAALPVADKSALKPGQTYLAALRLSLDKSQLPKPFQLDAIANRDWKIEARVLRWQFTPAGEAK